MAPLTLLRAYSVYAEFMRYCVVAKGQKSTPTLAHACVIAWHHGLLQCLQVAAGQLPCYRKEFTVQFPRMLLLPDDN